jgi:hypothetical protein
MKRRGENEGKVKRKGRRGGEGMSNETLRRGENGEEEKTPG